MNILATVIVAVIVALLFLGTVLIGTTTEKGSAERKVMVGMFVGAWAAVVYVVFDIW